MDTQKLEAFAAFLQKQQVRFINRKGRAASAAEFSKWLGISTPSLSKYMNALQLPTGENVYKLAAKLGPVVYDLLELPRMMPEDNKFHLLSDIFFDMTPEGQEELIEDAQQIHKRGQENTLQET